jgi:hypothetical protein
VREKRKSPLNTGDLDTLTALAAKVNRATLRDGVVPFYVSADGGDENHSDGWMFLAWPVNVGPSRFMAQRVFAAIGTLAEEYFNAEMQVTQADSEDADAR